MSLDEPETAADPNLGHVAAVHGSVLDVKFPEGRLPAINEALAIEWDRDHKLFAEVQQHLNATLVRAVALQTTSGLKRGPA